MGLVVVVVVVVVVLVLVIVVVVEDIVMSEVLTMSAVRQVSWSVGQNSPIQMSAHPLKVS